MYIRIVVIYAFLDRNIAYWDGPLRTSVRIPRSPEGLLLVTVPTKDGTPGTGLGTRADAHTTLVHYLQAQAKMPNCLISARNVHCKRKYR